MTVALSTLVLTIACELGIALTAMRWLAVPAKRLWVDVPLINLLTHPLGTLLIRNDIASFAVVEGMIVVTECLLYRSVTKLSWVQATGLSLLANGVTVGIALVIRTSTS